MFDKVSSYLLLHPPSARSSTSKSFFRIGGRYGQLNLNASRGIRVLLMFRAWDVRWKKKHKQSLNSGQTKTEALALVIFPAPLRRIES